MDPIHVLVISNPSAPHLSVLSSLSQPVHVCVAQDLELVSREAPDARVVMIGNFRMEPFRTVFPLAKRLDWVHSLAAGVDNFLFPEFISSPIRLTNGQGMFSEPLAEFAIAAMLFFSKDLRRMLNSQEAGRWDPFDVEMLRDHTLGIVGYGGIGKATAQLAHAMGMRVLALRKRAGLSTADPNVEAVYSPDRLREMLSLCDFVLMAAPLTSETRGMIGAAELSVLKSTAVVMNVGRGAVIVEAALVDALEQDRIRGAALDVFEHEPLPADHPFYRLKNVLLSPHCADRAPGWQQAAMQVFLDNFERYRNGQPLKNLVDKKAGY
jgi:phosphoglycerate dehydrogenase-like enzyme